MSVARSPLDDNWQQSILKAICRPQKAKPTRKEVCEVLRTLVVFGLLLHGAVQHDRRLRGNRCVHQHGIKAAAFVQFVHSWKRNDCADTQIPLQEVFDEFSVFLLTLKLPGVSIICFTKLP